ncbi:hypothetical protein GCM10027176_75510 [Actinoallomurus bryophytorum]
MRKATPSRIPSGAASRRPRTSAALSVSVSQEHLSCLRVAALSAGSALGGLVYGALPGRISGRARLPVLVTVPALGLPLAGLSPNVQMPAVVMILAAAGHSGVRSARLRRPATLCRSQRRSGR